MIASSNRKKTNNKAWDVLICNQVALVHMMEVAMLMFVIFVMVLLGLVFVAEIKQFKYRVGAFRLTCDDGHGGGCAGGHGRVPLYVYVCVPQSDCAEGNNQNGIEKY